MSLPLECSRLNIPVPRSSTNSMPLRFTQALTLLLPVIMSPTPLPLRCLPGPSTFSTLLESALLVVVLPYLGICGIKTDNRDPENDSTKPFVSLVVLITVCSYHFHSDMCLLLSSRVSFYRFPQFLAPFCQTPIYKKLCPLNISLIYC